MNFFSDDPWRFCPSSSDEDDDEEVEVRTIDVDVEDEANSITPTQHNMLFDPPTFEFATDSSIWDFRADHEHRVPTAASHKADGVVFDAAAAAAAASPPSPWRTSTAKSSIIDELKDRSSDVHKKCSTEAEKKKYFKQVR